MTPSLPVERQRSIRLDVLSPQTMRRSAHCSMLDKTQKRELLYKFLKQFKKSPSLWNTNNMYYYNRDAKEDALEVLLKLWNKYEPITLQGLKLKIQGIRSVYRRQRRKVESCAGASIPYVPTLWYYKHLNFLSGKKDTDSDDSDSDQNDETIYIQLPRGQKRSVTPSTDQEGDQEDPASSVDPSAAAFGRSVGAQLHYLSKMQRCIAEKLISDVIYYAKMDQLSLDTSVTKVIQDVEHKAATLIPKAGPSWYDTDLDNGSQESSASLPLPTETTEDLVRREMEETQNAVNFIKMERDDMENYIFQDDDGELNNAIDNIVKEEY